MNNHKQTEKILKNNERQLNNAYTDAYKSIKSKVVEIYSKINLDKESAVDRLVEANKYERLDNMINYVVEKLVLTNAEQIKNLNKLSNDVFYLNYNGVVEDLQKQGVDIDKITKTEANEENIKNPFNKVAIDNIKDKTQANGKTRNALLNAILGGASVGVALKNIKDVFESNLKSQVRIYENTLVGAENQGTLTAFEDAKDKGYQVIKIWRTQEDDRVRSKHARAEGQEALVDEPFFVGGERLMCPHDLNGSEENTIGCRCYMEYRIKKR